MDNLGRDWLFNTYDNVSLIQSVFLLFRSSLRSTSYHVINNVYNTLVSWLINS